MVSANDLKLAAYEMSFQCCIFLSVKWHGARNKADRKALIRCEHTNQSLLSALKNR